MKFCLKSVLILFAIVFALGEFQVEDVSAQGPIIRRMREKLNNGKPLLPFVEDESDKSDKSDKPSKKLTPASKKPTLARSKKEPTPAKKPNAAGRDKEKYRGSKLESGSSMGKKNAGRAGVSREFGMAIEKVGESIVVSQVANRGNASDAGVKRGDVVLAVGGAKLSVVEEFDAIADAMSGGDRVEFEFTRRGSKDPEKVFVQFGQPEERDDEAKATKFDEAPKLDAATASTKRTFADRYKPSIGSGLKSIYDDEGVDKLSSVLMPTPAPNRVESLKELDFPALEGGK